MANESSELADMVKNIKNVRNLEPVKMHKGFPFIGADKNVPQNVWYKGIALPTFSSMCLDVMENMKFDSSDVFLCGLNKTGTTWLCEIIYHLLTEGKDLFNPSLPGITERIPIVSDPVVGASKIISTPPPRFIRSHLSYYALPASYREVKPKTIYLMRNPRDTCVSSYHFSRSLKFAPFNGSFGEFLEAFLAGDVSYGPFTTSIRSFWENQENLNIMFVSYEDVHKDFEKEVKRIADFLHVKADNILLSNIQKATSLEAMRANQTVNYNELKGKGFHDQSKRDWFMRKGIVGDWKNHFTEEQVKRMDALVDKELTPLGVTFCYEFDSSN